MVAVSLSAAVVWQGGEIVEASKFTPREYEGGVLLVASGVVVATPNTTNRVWWAFDATNQLFDSSFNLNDGTEINTPTFVPQIASISPYYDFDLASEESIRKRSANNIPQSAGPYTLTAWFKTDSTASRSILWVGEQGRTGAEEEIRLFMDGDGNMRARVADDAGSQQAESVGVYSDGVWHFVAARYTTTVLRDLWIDGVVDGINTTFRPFPDGMDAVAVGAIDGDDLTGTYFDGGIDDPQVWRVALSNAQLQELMDSTKAGKGLLANGADTNNPTTAHLMEYAGVSADASGNGDHATIDGATFAVNTNGSERTGYYVFDGVNDQMNIGAPLSSNMIFGASSFTVNAWIKPRGVSFVSGAGIVTYKELGGSQRGPFDMLIGADDNLYFRVYDDDGFSGYIARLATTPLASNEWNMVTGVWTGGTTDAAIKVYVNGAQVDDTNKGVGTFSSLNNGTGARIRFGDHDDMTLPYEGDMDDVRIYTKTLTTQAITNLFTATKELYL